MNTQQPQTPTTASGEPRAAGDIVCQVIARITARSQDDPERKRLIDEFRYSPHETEYNKRKASLDKLAKARGERYADCKFSNYEATTDAQRKAVERLKAYAESFDEHRKHGRGIVLFGTVGTGKDHLMFATMSMVMRLWGASAAWTNGATLFGEMRDNIGRDESESKLVYRYTSPDILAISDPTPPDRANSRTELTDYQASAFYRIIDDRYSSLKPTFVTINVSKSTEAREKIGAAIIDRLTDGALTIHCDWKSKRQPLG